ncbi:MAG: hypothetical protein F6J93_08640 [Oscillatoria sp. SIO1A7]|nr:hypothetical protein [Oscillatoria sp. SIO1A7]
MSSVNQAVYVPGTNIYKFLTDASGNLPITGAPADTNWRRWSMLHDGGDYRMYFFKSHTSNKLYQFGWDGSSYKHGHNSIPELEITGIPDDADTGSFSMLYGEEHYRLYFRQLGNPTQLYQFLWKPGTTTYAPGPTLKITGFPDDTDWSRWSMLNDGDDYRIYAFKLGSNSEFYQGAWNGSAYEYGHKSYKVLTLEGTPSNSNLASMAMLHDGSKYRFYMQAL